MGKKINIQSLDELQQFMNDNLVSKQEAYAITGQSMEGFSQSVKLGLVKPFYESEGAGRAKTRLYLKSDLEKYRDSKRS